MLEADAAKINRSTKTVSDFIQRTSDFGGTAHIKQIATFEGNQICADCNAPDNCWVSTGIGVFVCMDCAGHHRALGGKYGKISSLKQETTMFTLENIQLLETMGNVKANETYDSRCPTYYMRACEVPKSEIIRENWIRAKYSRKEFVIEKYRGSDAKEEKHQSVSVGKSEYEHPFYTMPQAVVEGFLSKIDKKKHKQYWCQLQIGIFSVYKSPTDSHPESSFSVANSKIVVTDTSRQADSCLLIDIINRDSEETVSFEVLEVDKVFGWVHSLRRASVYYAIDANKSKSLTQTQLSTISDEVKNTAEQKGYLKKSGNKRWVILAQNSMFWFKSKKGTEPDGMIPLIDAYCSICDIDRSGKKKHMFMIQTAARNYFLQASNNKEMEDWIETIRKTIDHFSVYNRIDFNELKYIM